MHSTVSPARTWRIRVSALIASASVVFAIASQHSPPIEHRLPLGGSAPAEGESGFRSTQTDEEKQQVLDSIRDALKSALSDPALFLEPDDMQNEMMLILRAIVEERASRYFRNEIERGGSFNRSVAVAMVKERRSWGILDEAGNDPATLSDEQVFSFLWEQAAKHGFAIHGIDFSQIHFGRGMTQQVGGVTWPHEGMFDVGSVFVSPKGPLMFDEGERINGSSGSAFIRLRVRWADAGTGHIRVNFYHDGEAWRPLSISIACTGTNWPWPLL